jgi:hypothetical protein
MQELQSAIISRHSATKRRMWNTVILAPELTPCRTDCQCKAVLTMSGMCTQGRRRGTRQQRRRGQSQNSWSSADTCCHPALPMCAHMPPYYYEGLALVVPVCFFVLTAFGIVMCTCCFCPRQIAAYVMCTWCPGHVPMFFCPVHMLHLACALADWDCAHPAIVLTACCTMDMLHMYCPHADLYRAHVPLYGKHVA